MITFSVLPRCAIILHRAVPYCARSKEGAGAPTAAHRIKVQRCCDSICWVPSYLEHTQSLPPHTWGMSRARLTLHLPPLLLITTETAHTTISGSWVLQALLPLILQSFLKGEKSRSLETCLSREREKILPLMHGCHSKTKLVLCKGREKVKVWT